MKWIILLGTLSAIMAFSTSTNEHNICGSADVIVPSSLYANKSLHLKVQDVSDFSFQVYNWKGKKVFQALVDVTYLPEELKNNIQQKKVDVGWSGTNDMRGDQIKAGNYIYIIEATCTANANFRRGGNITLIK